jgi:hypothetical protein
MEKTIEAKVVSSQVSDGFTSYSLLIGKKDVNFVLPIEYMLEPGDMIKFFDCRIKRESGYYYIDDACYKNLHLIKKGREDYDLEIYSKDMIEQKQKELKIKLNEERRRSLQIQF